MKWSVAFRILEFKEKKETLRIATGLRVSDSHTNKNSSFPIAFIKRNIILNNYGILFIPYRHKKEYFSV